jgi:hypothetical protein
VVELVTRNVVSLFEFGTVVAEIFEAAVLPKVQAPFVQGPSPGDDQQEQVWLTASETAVARPAAISPQVVLQINVRFLRLLARLYTRTGTLFKMRLIEFSPEIFQADFAWSAMGADRLFLGGPQKRSSMQVMPQGRKPKAFRFPPRPLASNL